MRGLLTSYVEFREGSSFQQLLDASAMLCSLGRRPSRSCFRSKSRSSGARSNTITLPLTCRTASLIASPALKGLARRLEPQRLRRVGQPTKLRPRTRRRKFSPMGEKARTSEALPVRWSLAESPCYNLRKPRFRMNSSLKTRFNARFPIERCQPGGDVHVLHTLLHKEGHDLSSSLPH